MSQVVIRETACLNSKGKEQHLADEDIAVEAAVDVGAALHADQAVLLGVVEPVAGAPCADEPLQLVCLHPDQLIHSLVAPDLQALAAELHRAPCSRHTNHSVVILAYH